MPIQYNLKSYHRPENVEAAIDLLSSNKHQAKVIAGGTDLLPGRQGGTVVDTVHHLIDISGLTLKFIKKNKDDISIGAATDINHIAASPVLSSNPYKVLVEAANAHSTHTIRNRATIGGNLCNASPCADLALPLLVLSAVVVAAGPNGKRMIQLDSFFKGPNCTVLEPDEILMEIRIPLQNECSGASFVKLRHHQTAVDMAVVNACSLLSFKDNRCVFAKIAIGAAGPTSFLAKKAAGLLSGQAIDQQVIRQAAAVSSNESSPVTDIRATADYRRKMVAILVEDSLEKSLQRSL